MIRRLSYLALLSLTCTLLFACARSPEEAAIDAAQEDLRCDDVTIVSVDVEQSSRPCPPMRVSTFGCGRTADYTCKPGSRSCHYRCRRGW